MSLKETIEFKQNVETERIVVVVKPVIFITHDDRREEILQLFINTFKLINRFVLHDK